jgi:hypothetical protein
MVVLLELVQAAWQQCFENFVLPVIVAVLLVVLGKPELLYFRLVLHWDLLGYR